MSGELTITEMVELCYSNSKEKGFWEASQNISEKVMLVVTELAEAVEAYRDYILNGKGKHLLDDLGELEGKILGCWCKPKSCHGDILIEIIEERIKPKSKKLF